MTQSHLSALPAPLRSAVLTNTLAQLTTAPSYPVQTTTLLAPLTRRREVLDNGPTARLERAAQALVLRVGGSVAGGIGAGAGWVTWAGGASWIAGSGAAEMLEAAGTGAGVGLLLALSGVRWAITRWEKARKSWWRDWKRVSDGVGRDVQVRFPCIQKLSNPFLTVFDEWLGHIEKNTGKPGLDCAVTCMRWDRRAGFQKTRRGRPVEGGS